jgi:hypothetical protein
MIRKIKIKTTAVTVLLVEVAVEEAQVVAAVLAEAVVVAVDAGVVAEVNFKTEDYEKNDHSHRSGFDKFSLACFNQSYF